jgi:Cation transporter/ATPase, N-terminus
MNVPVFSSSRRHTDPSAASSSEAEELFAVCRLGAAQCWERLGSGQDGLSVEDAATRLKRYGPNLVTRERKPTIAENSGIGRRIRSTRCC